MTNDEIRKKGPHFVIRNLYFVIVFWFPVVLWCSLIYCFSDIPDLSTGLGDWDLFARKLAHVAEYGILAALTWRAVRGGRPIGLPVLFWGSLGFSILYAVTDEFHQGFVPGRYPSVLDVLLDSLGAALAVVVLKRRLNSRGTVPPGSVKVLALSAALLLSGAGCVRARFSAARRQEKAGRYEQALNSYIRLAEREPEHGLAPEALYRAGNLASSVLTDYSLARELFQRLLNRYGDVADWGSKAERALFNSPDYFPLTPGAEWMEGDSETGGRNARIEIVARALESGSGAAFSRKYYAGNNFMRNLSLQRVYRKEGMELREYRPGEKEYTVILKYPFDAGAAWTSTRGGRHLRFSIQGTATVRVGAGEFKNCLAVREQPEGNTGSWKVDYYAPGIGKILTTLATDKSEKRNTELLSYNLGTE